MWQFGRKEAKVLAPATGNSYFALHTLRMNGFIVSQTRSLETEKRLEFQKDVLLHGPGLCLQSFSAWKDSLSICIHEATWNRMWEAAAFEQDSWTSATLPLVPMQWKLIVLASSAGAY